MEDLLYNQRPVGRVLEAVQTGRSDGAQALDSDGLTENLAYWLCGLEKFLNLPVLYLLLL